MTVRAITCFHFNSRFSVEHELASFHCFSSSTCARREHLGISGTGFFTDWMPFLLPSVLWRCWLGGRKGIRPVKNMGDGGGGHWLVRMEWRPAGWSVCLPLLIFPCTIKSRSSLLAPAYPDGPGKRAVKLLWCWMPFLLPSQQCQLKALKETKHWPQPVVWSHVFPPSATNCQLQILCIIVLYHYYYLRHGGI